MTKIFPVDDMPAPLQPFAYAMLHSLYAWTIRCAQVVAGAGVFDTLGDEPATAAVLAKLSGCNADALERMLRLLASVDIGERTADGRFRHNAVSRSYRSDVRPSAIANVRLMSSPLFQAAMADLGETLRHGGSSLKAFAPEGLWAYYTQHPEEARNFDQAMSNQSAAANLGLMAAYDFSGLGVIADIGGGQGGTLIGILDASPSAQGILFDLPEVVASAATHPRMRALGGSFLKDPLPGACDVYILKFVLHDWPDEQALEILAAVRKAAKPGARLVVIESLLSEGADLHPSLMMNVSMLALFGGRERTPNDFAVLFDKAGFKFARTISTPVPMVSIIEGEAI